MVFLSEKFPNWGLKWSEKVGFVEEKKKWALKTRGDWFAEPKRPRPDLRERENGGEDVEVGV